MQPEKRWKGSGLALAVAVLLFASGCAVVPRSFTDQELRQQAEADVQTLFLDQEPVGERIGLYEAMARGVRYNLDHRVKRMEEALARANLVQAQTDLLPQLVTSAGYTARSNESGSVSQSLLTGQQSLEASTSQEKEQFAADVIYVWNILDFGVGYTQAQQRADEVLVSEEWRRKAVQNIVQDVRYAYWRAVSAEQLLPEMDALLATVESALARAKEMEAQRAQPPVKLLAYQQELLETVKQLWAMRRDLSLAKTELAALMNLRPGVEFRLGQPESQPYLDPQTFSRAALEDLALVSRPELRVEAYQQRISALEGKKALLRMLPGLEINLGAYYDDNRFLFNNSWTQAGLHLTWNVFNLLSGRAAIDNAAAQEELARQRHLAMTMMVLAQVNLAMQRYHLANKEMSIAARLDDVHSRKMFHAEAARQASTGNELEEIRSKAAALAARMHHGLAFAEVQGALGRLYHSVGIDPLPAALVAADMEALAVAMQDHEERMLGLVSQSAEAPLVKSFAATVSETEGVPATAGPALEAAAGEIVEEVLAVEKASEPATPAPAAEPLPAAEKAEPPVAATENAVASQEGQGPASEPEPLDATGESPAAVAGTEMPVSEAAAEIAAGPAQPVEAQEKAEPPFRIRLRSLDVAVLEKRQPETPRGGLSYGTPASQ